MKSFALISICMGLAALLAGLAPVPAVAQGSEQPQGATMLTQGRLVYDAYCAPCHGLTGKGDGPEAQGFVQPPTNFTLGKYMLRSTTSAIPAPGDVARTIREGMSGTEMVAFKEILSERSIADVAAYVKAFSPALANPNVKPPADSIIKIPKQRPFPRTAQTIAEGKKVWADEGCADCHGKQGQGMADQADDAGRHIEMVPFQDGYYKSGPADSDLYRTILAGMKNTTMDAYKGEVSDQDAWKLVDYIRSLSESNGASFIAKVLHFVGSRPSGFDYSNY